jgi:hypothetical protein
MKKIKKPLVWLDVENEMELKNIRLIPQVPYYPFRNNDEISIRNMDIRIRWETMSHFEFSFDKKIKYIKELYHTSEENIKRIISDNTKFK